MSGSRIKNTKRNIFFSLFEAILTIGFQFVSRSIIVYVFNDQYLGLSSLFTSILQVLNMADLGFSTAIVYNMYKPIANHDEKAICALMNYYKRIYRIVGTVILCVGLAMTPFIPHLIEGDPPAEINIYYLYFLYLLNTSLSYCIFAYKSALLNALQRMDLMKIAYALANVTQYILQIICLLVFKNFYYFIGCMVLGTIFKNCACEYISKKRFPEYHCVGEISLELKNDINSRVKGLLIGNISNVTYTTLDSIILSAYLGLGTVAIYNNYLLVIVGITKMVEMVRNAMQASVGNSIAVESEEKNYKDMLLWQFLFSVMAGWCATCMFNLYQPFMTMWMGEDSLLPMRDVVLLCICFFVSVVPLAFYLYLTGNGMWWEMKWPYIMSTICNLIMNCVLGKIWGVTGIILSTVIASLIFGLIWQCLIVFKLYYPNSSSKDYLIRQLILFALCVVSCTCSYLINSLIHLSGILELLTKGIISTVVSMFVYILFYRNTDVFKRTVSFVKSAIKI